MDNLQQSEAKGQSLLHTQCGTSYQNCLNTRAFSRPAARVDRNAT